MKALDGSFFALLNFRGYYGYLLSIDRGRDQTLGSPGQLSRTLGYPEFDQRYRDQLDEAVVFDK